jgi:DNA-binding HxlR family transcriptional regulator
MYEKEERKRKNRTKACMFTFGGQTVCVDPSLPLFNLLGKKDSILVIGVIGNRSGKNNFNEILADIPGSSTTLISRRIKEFIAAGIVSRNESEAGITYALTPFGETIRESLLPLLKILDKINPQAVKGQ